MDIDQGRLDTINFVLETMPQQATGLKTEALYKIHFVAAGKGRLHTLGKITPLRAGDIFFTFPAEAFAIESEEGFSYLYVSFLGSGGYRLLEQLHIDRHNAVFHGCSSLKSFWQNAIEMQSPFPELTSKSVLLYTFAYLAQLRQEQKSLQKGQ